MKRILIIEDDTSLADSISCLLRNDNLEIFVAGNGRIGYDRASREQYDLIILDVMLPGLNGFQILRKLRNRQVDTPVLMLTEKHETDDIVEGMNNGADAYLGKPFNFRELQVRVNALLTRPPQSIGSTDKVGQWEIDLPNKLIYYRGKIIHMQKLDIMIMKFLLARVGRTVNRLAILNNVWATSNDRDERIVDVHISRIRKALYGTNATLKTVMNVGYRLELDESI